LLQHGFLLPSGVSCELLSIGTNRETILAAVGRRGGPRLVGISVGLVESIPAALELWRELDRQLPRETRFALGGQAFRRGPRATVEAEVPVLRSLDEFLAWIQPFSPEPPPELALDSAGRSVDLPRGGGGAR
jgi:hypothetical protein